MPRKRRTKAQIEMDEADEKAKDLEARNAIEDRNAADVASEKAETNESVAAWGKDAENANKDTTEPESPELTADDMEAKDTLPTMDAALLYAQRSVIGIFKDAKHPKFKYTRGESMIKFARTVLHKVGIVVHEAGNTIDELPGGQLVMHGRFHIGYPASDEKREILRSHLIVTHSEKGNPIRTADKAAHGTATENLAYFLRGLLAVPRFEDDEDLNAEAGVTDPEYFETPKKTGEGIGKEHPAVQKLSEPPVLWMTDERVDTIRKLITATESNESKLLNYYSVASIGLLTENQYKHLLPVLNLKLEMGNTARKFGGHVTKVEPKTPPPTAEGGTGGPEAAQIVAGDEEQKLSEAQVELLLKSLVAKHKKGSDLLAHFAYADMFDFPVSMFNEVMAWVRA